MNLTYCHSFIDKNTQIQVLNYIKEVKTACLWKKKSSTFEPDFCPVKLDGDPWIVQPTEHYEELSIEEIIKKNQLTGLY